MKILILTASAGNGHNSTAQKITAKILSKHKDAEIKTVDMYKTYAPKLKAWAMSKGYALACNHVVGIYNYFFRKSEKSNIKTKDTAKVNKDVYDIIPGILNEIYSFKPDIIICTYIFAAVAMTNIKRCYDIPAKICCMTLDYGISPYWECAADGLDKMFLTDKYMVEPFLKKGFKKSQIVVSGIPVDDEFSNTFDRQKTRQSLGFDKDMFTLLVARSSFFSVKPHQLVKEFSKIIKPIQIVICNGKDKKGMEQIQKHLDKANLPHKVIQLGFITRLAPYFAASDLILSKGGGLTLTESLTSGVPTIVIHKLPQQEIYNKEYLVKHGCSLSVDKKHSISHHINNVLTNPKIYKSLIKNIEKIRKKNTLNAFLNFVESCPQADYKDKTLKDSKKEIIRKIDKKRKETIKNQSQK